MADLGQVMETHRIATPYRMGSSVTSVELLLEARTAAEAAAPLATRSLATAIRLDTELEVVNVRPGPVEWDGALRFVAEARSSVLGSLLVEAGTVMVLADLIMGGRGVAEDRVPSKLEMQLFAERMLEPVSTLLESIAPGRPDPIALHPRELGPPGRSILVELGLAHENGPMTLVLEVLAHHLADEQHEVDADRMEAICGEVPLELTFRFAPVQLPARDVAGLAPGDVICLEHPAAAPLIGVVDGRPFVQARMGVSRRHAAVEVVDVIERSD